MKTETMILPVKPELVRVLNAVAALNGLTPGQAAIKLLERELGVCAVEFQERANWVLDGERPQGQKL